MNKRMGRIFALSTTVALAYIGQGLLQAEPPRLLDGTVFLLLAAAAFIGMAAWSRARGEPYPERLWIARLQAFVEHFPQSFTLLALSIVYGVLAYGFESYPTLLPWPTLVMWSFAIGFFLAGAWLLEHPGPGARAVELPRPAARQARDEQAPATPGTAPGELVPRAGEVALDTQIEVRTEYRLAREPGVAMLPQRYARWEIMALLALTLLALLGRALLVQNIPQNFGGDEGEMGVIARAVLRGEMRDPFATAWLSHPTLWFFVQACSLWIFGDNVWGLRMLSALIGTATIPALYLFARPLYGRPVGLAATALLATYHFHIHFSRLAVNNIVDPLLALLSFAAFFNGRRTSSWFSFALAGVLLGLGQHFYMGGRLTPLVVLALLLHAWLLDRHWLLNMRWRLALLGIGFVLAFGPLLRFFLLNHTAFTARLAAVGIFQTGWFAQQQAQGMSTIAILLHQTRDAFGAFTFQPDRSTWYDPHIPLLDRASAVLFVFGLAITISRWRRMEMVVLIAWLVGAAVFGGVLLKNTPESPRYVTTAPALCLLIALALEELMALVRWAFPLGQRAAYAVCGVAVLLLALWNLNFYFREYTPRRTFGWLNTEAATAIGAYLHEQPGHRYVYFFGPPRIFIGHGTIRFLAPGVPGIDVVDPVASPDELPPTPPGDRPIFIFLPERAGELEVVQRRFPGGTMVQERAWRTDSTLFLSYEPK